MHHWLSVSLMLFVSVGAQNSSIASIPESLTYYIPADNFTSDIAVAWVNSTITSNASVNALLTAAKTSTFISYTDEFLSIIGDSPSISSIPCPAAGNDSCAFEAGVWIPDTNEVWFTPSSYEWPDLEEGLTAFNLDNNSARKLSTTGPLYGNGGYLFDGKVWFASNAPEQGIPSTIFSVDVDPPHTVEPLINSYFGVPFPSADEPVWVTRGDDKYLFFTGVDFNAFFAAYPAGPLPNAVWRFDPQAGFLQPVVDRFVTNTPNGIRVSSDQRTLYVTNSEELTKSGGGAGSNAGTTVPGIYKFDLDADAYPVNGRLWGLARTGIPDGIHVDDRGRVWTGEGDGIVVRSPKGKVLGEVNALQLPKPAGTAAIANFALAGNKLVIGAYSHAIVVTLNETLVGLDSTIVN